MVKRHDAMNMLKSAVSRLGMTIPEFQHEFAQGATTSVVAAQLIVSQVCNGRRRSGFGYYWEFPHRGRPMALETRKKRR